MPVRISIDLMSSPVRKCFLRQRARLFMASITRCPRCFLLAERSCFVRLMTHETSCIGWLDATVWSLAIHCYSLYSLKSQSSDLDLRISTPRLNSGPHHSRFAFATPRRNSTRRCSSSKVASQSARAGGRENCVDMTGGAPPWQTTGKTSCHALIRPRAIPATKLSV